MSDQTFRSAKRRIFVSPAIGDGVRRCTLGEATAHYLTRVLRLKAATEVDFADGSVRLYRGQLTQDGSEWPLDALRVIHQEPADPERNLAAALIKPDRWE